MLKSGSLGRFRSLSNDRKRLLLRAAGLLTAISAAVALLPFREAIRLGCVPLGRGRLSMIDCVWAVETAARRLPWRTMCIEQGIAAQRVLRRAGIDARLYYGARHAADSGQLEAHVWVAVNGEIVIGADEASGFAAVATYP